MDIEDAVAARFEELRASLRKSGKVTGTAGAKVVVNVMGSSLTLSKLSSYTPTIGDVVHIDAAVPGSWLVLGKSG